MLGYILITLAGCLSGLYLLYGAVSGNAMHGLISLVTTGQAPLNQYRVLWSLAPIAIAIGLNGWRVASGADRKAGIAALGVCLLSALFAVYVCYDVLKSHE